MTPAAARSTTDPARFASLMLVLATVLWGCSFTWGKVAADSVNRAAGLSSGALLGPMFIIATRFTGAGLLMMLRPAAWRGWTLRSLRRATLLGVLQAVAIGFQLVGLDRTSEAVSAFLTSMSVLFVPLLMTFALGKAPRPIVWAGVAIAVVGIWLMTGATPEGFGLEEALGLGCSVAYSVYILVVNAILPKEDPWKMTAGHFIVTAAIAWAICLGVDAGPGGLAPSRIVRLTTAPGVAWNLPLLILLPTLIAFILLIYYQPKVDETRAALLYLAEPIFAAAFAWAVMGRGLTPIALVGAGLILVANVLVELLSKRATSGARAESRAEVVS